jgi:hypothetical protein
MAVTFMISSFVILKLGLKKSMILASFAAMVTALGLGFSVYGGQYEQLIIIIIPSILVPILASLAVSSSFLFMQLVATRRIRATIMAIFNGVAYGVGGLMFGLLGPILFDFAGGLEK